MKVTHVSLRPTDAATDAGRPALTPELLAASGARYSRNNEGLEAIISRIDFAHADAAVDGIFRMIDYGHQSIADMVPIAIFIDGISLWLAYYIWTLCPTAGGQESSTRYLALAVEDMIAPDLLGIPSSRQAEWRARMTDCFQAYRSALALWQQVADDRPEVTRIPRALRDDPAEKVARQVARMTQNYAFDRSRYFLPTAAATNVMLVMSARGWVSLCQHLLSHTLPEATALGQALASELALTAPRLLRHAVATDSLAAGLRQEYADTQALAGSLTADYLADEAWPIDHPPAPYLSVYPPDALSGQAMAGALRYHDNRYAWMGTALRRTPVRFGWGAVTFGEIRDLNRHRTGAKYCPLMPVGFYAAQDQAAEAGIHDADYQAICATGKALSARARALLTAGDPSYLYWTALGTQFPFEHVTTADKLIYEAELRTGTGAHFRYARHLHEILALWYAHYPETRGLVIEGGAEPE